MNCGFLILGGFEGKEVTPLVRDLILKEKILGFTLFRRNIDSAEQLRALNDELQALAHQAGYTLTLAVDQEGGRVERLPDPFSKIRPMREWVQKKSQNSRDNFFENVGSLIGSEVALAGFNLDFAPVVDVDTNEKNPIIGDRSFSSHVETVIDCAGSFLKGLHAHGIRGCLKHFPSHGHTAQDSHFELPVDDRDLQTLTSVNIVAYEKLFANGLADSIMTAHVIYPQIDPDFPATLSEIHIKKILREQIGYDGLLFSDDLLMKAIDGPWKIEDAIRRFLTVGGDVALICEHAELSREAIQRLKTDLSSLEKSCDLSAIEKRILKFQSSLTKNPPAFASFKDVVKKNKTWTQTIFATGEFTS